MFQTLGKSPNQKEHVYLPSIRRRINDRDNILTWHTRSARRETINAVYRLEKPVVQKVVGSEPEGIIPAVTEPVQS